MSNFSLNSFCWCWLNTTCLSFTQNCSSIQQTCNSSFCQFYSCKNTTHCFDSVDYYQNSLIVYLIMITIIMCLLIFRSIVSIQVNWIKASMPKTEDDETPKIMLHDLNSQQLNGLRTFTKRIHLH